MPHRRTYLRSLTALGATTLLAGCGGDGDGDGGGPYGGGGGGDTETPEPTATATATPADDGAADTTAAGTDAAGTTTSAGQAAYPDYTWDQLEDASPSSETTTVTMSGFAFDPLVATVPAGEAIAFPNEDGSPHTVTIPALDVDEDVEGGGETSVTVEEPGTYDYVCELHPPEMLGRLVVE